MRDSGKRYVLMCRCGNEERQVALQNGDLVACHRCGTCQRIAINRDGGVTITPLQYVGARPWGFYTETTRGTRI